ncbi:unnamed protein product, partial [Closterium sp. NIES-53]
NSVVAHKGYNPIRVTRGAAACLAICNHLPLAERAHFGQHKTAKALYDAVVARYSSPATAGLDRLILPYLFPELSASATVEDLITHLGTSDTRYRTALPAEFLEKNPPPMYITLYFIVTCLPDSLRAVRDHFLALNPTDLLVPLLAHPSLRELCDEAERLHWLELLRSGVDIVALDYDAILAAMYALTVSAEGDCYLYVPLNQGIEAAALGASEFALPSTAPAEALHTFILDSGASRCLHLPSFSTNLLSTTALQDTMVTTTTPAGQRVSICTCTRTGRHLATFTRRPGSGLYTLTTEPPQVGASAQVSASGPVAAPCSCRLQSHQTLLWHHHLGHPSLPHLRGMHSCLLVSGLPRSLPPLPPSPAPPSLPYVKGRQCAAPHSSSFPPTSAPLHTLHVDVRGPTRVSRQGRERYFLLVVDDYMCYTTVFPLRSKGEVLDVFIPWIRAVRLQLHERFREDFPVLHLHSHRDGEFSSDLLRDICRGEGILQSFTLTASSWGC